MKNTILSIFLCLLSACSNTLPAFAVGSSNEALNANDPNYNIELNDLLQQINAGITLLSTNANQASQITGIVTTAHGGTGKNFSAVAANAIPYFSATGTMGNIGIGTTGYVLTAGSPPNWAAPVSPGLKLISTNTLTGVTNSGNIVITNTKRYFIVFDLDNFSSSSEVWLRINNDSGSVYKYVVRGASVAGVTLSGAGTGADHILLMKQFTGTNTYDKANGYVYIYPQESSSHYEYVRSETWGNVTTGADQGYFSGFGSWIEPPDAATSFRILTDGTQTVNGHVYLYEITTS